MEREIFISLTEVIVELYSFEAEGRRGVWYDFFWASHLVKKKNEMKVE